MSTTSSTGNVTKLVYYLTGEDTPYMKKMHCDPSKVTLSNVKNCLKLSEPHDFYFKSQEECGVVKECISEDNEPVPLFNGHVICYIAKKSQDEDSQNNPPKNQQNTISPIKHIKEACQSFRNDNRMHRNYSNASSLSSIQYQRNMSRNHYMNKMDNTMSSLSSISDSNCSLDVLRVVLDMDKYPFLGISIVGQSNENQDGGIYVGSIIKGGAIDLDGRIEPGDMILDVNGIDFEKLTNEKAVQSIREAVSNKGKLVMTVVKCWSNFDNNSMNSTLLHNPTKMSVNQMSQNGIDPTSWVAKTTGMRNPYHNDTISDERSMVSDSTLLSSVMQSSGYGETVVYDCNLSVNSDMATVVSKMAAVNSGLDICDRTWLKLKIPNAFLGSELVKWLHRRIEGFADRKDAKKYASNLLKYGYIQHTANKGSFSEQCYYTISNIHHRDTSSLTIDNYSDISLRNVPPPMVNKQSLSWNNPIQLQSQGNHHYNHYEKINNNSRNGSVCSSSSYPSKKNIQKNNYNQCIRNYSEPHDNTLTNNGVNMKDVANAFSDLRLNRSNLSDNNMRRHDSSKSVNSNEYTNSNQNYMYNKPLNHNQANRMRIPSSNMQTICEKQNDDLHTRDFNRLKNCDNYASSFKMAMENTKDTLIQKQ